MRGPSSATVVAAAAALLVACGDPLQPSRLPGAAPPSPRTDGAAAAAAGSWSPLFAWPIVAAHLTVLPDGKVIGWTSDDMDHTHQTANVYVWDPANPGAFTQVRNRETDVFCAGHSLLPNGDVMVAGGHVTVDVGVSDANIFNWQSRAWSRVVSMRAGRWYPTTVTLGNGDVAVAAGNDEHHEPNPYPEVWETKNQRWRLLGGAPFVMPYYPRLHLAPDGRVFMSGPEARSRYLNPTGSGQWSDGPTSQGRERSEGTSIMYQPGKLLIVGGGDPATNTAETLDLNVPGARWQPTGSMQYPRRHFSSQILPDGKVLVVGGTAAGNEESQRVLPSELWDPATGQWTTLGRIATTRTYHSSSVLLLDGRVLNAGGGRCGETCPNYPDAQFFSPPYLFNEDGSAAARPAITSAPGFVEYGQAFTVRTPDAARVARVTWLRLSSFTHAIDMNQRFAELAFTPGTDALTVTAPSNPNLVPPGHYMMFLLDGRGVPSVASVVQIRGGAATPDLPPPEAPSTVAAAPRSNSQVTVRWADNSTSETGFRVERCEGVGCTTGFVEVGTTAPNALSYTDGGLAAATRYGYRVRAENSAGLSSYDGPASARTRPAPGAVVHRVSGRCMDVLGGSQTNGTRVVLGDCTGAVNQTWSVASVGTSGEALVYGAKCMDAYTALGNDGDPMVVWDCLNGANQHWTLTAAGELKGINGKCIDAVGGGTTSGTGLALAPCTGAASQQWSAAGTTPDAPPEARFTASCTDLACTFDSNGATDDEAIASRSWTFGDGTVGGNVVAPAVTYAAAGTYTVTLTVTDAARQTHSQTRTVTAVRPNQLPVAGFTVACTALACTFSDASTDPDGNATLARWSWAFGDAVTSAERSPAHTYAAGGTYTVALTVTDDRGGTHTSSRAVTVNAPLLAAQPLVSVASGRCLDVLGARRTAGTPVVIYACHTGENQKFAVTDVGATGEIRVYGTMCLEPASVARGAATANGDTVVIRACAGTPAQQWTRTTDGRLRGLAGRCLDVLGARKDNLTTVWLWSCHGGDNQRWTSGTASATGSAIRTTSLAEPRPPGEGEPLVRAGGS